MKKIQLFCLPHAGGSAMVFHRWKSSLSPDIDVIPIELRGRGSRVGESFYESFEEAVDDIYSAISSKIAGPYAIFGHSMGSWMALELYYRLAQSIERLPVHLMLSGNRAPHIVKDECIHALPDEEFRETIQRMGGTSDEIFTNKELFSLFAPALRADFRIVERFNFQPKSFKVQSDITVLTGRSDTRVKSSDLIGWKRYAGSQCEIVKLEGGHFYIQENVQETTRIINEKLQPYLI
ncbi:alpha/beta fold hydrolase [Paenibacillus polysaccharolyticus]|uniref:thioesterase II family protein n=1 Tax=Paenibacillus polysaccharolyticus TaxID=582692 RepID=UPI00203ADAB0|nr:alpha/beta fold hydrolase [Paenibacillus polysaccharolyticus]MCM3133481.1 alpha/beta fold hydrolase [Paenibacillus polysaccharolyticus]